MKYYTYTHSSPSGNVFYVGKGSGKRVYSTHDRGYLWHEMREKCGGILMKIVEWFETEEEAFSRELELISSYRTEGVTLVNRTDGGSGPNGYAQSPESRAIKSMLMVGYKHKILTCPHCGYMGGGTSIFRWHFDNCRGIRPQHKARATINGTRVYLGKFSTKDEADTAVLDYYAEHGVPVPKEFYRSGTGRERRVTVPSGSNWIIL